MCFKMIVAWSRFRFQNHHKGHLHDPYQNIASYNFWTSISNTIKLNESKPKD